MAKNPEKKPKKITFEDAFRYVGAILTVALLIMAVIICAQFAASDEIVSNNKQPWLYVMAILCSILLAASVILKFYVIKNPNVKMVIYICDMFFLFVISLITGSSFIVVLYCLVTTEYYISNESLKKAFIMFGISVGSYIISFVCGWVRVYRGVSTQYSLVEVFGNILSGVIVLILHFVLVTFIVRFYRNNKRLSEALKAEAEGKEELKKAYDKLAVTVVYEERNRIAQDIHDNVGHSITTVIMQTEAAKLLIDTDPEEAKNKIISANIQAKSALDQMRTSVHLLAGRRTGGSLKDDIEQIVSQTMDGTDLKIRMDVEDISVDEERALFINNSVKECIANGIRHGGATAFYIELKKEDDNIRVLVSDNGKGVKGGVKEGFGLSGMRAKTEAFGGKLSVVTDEDDGFEVSFYIPLNTPKKED